MGESATRSSRQFDRRAILRFIAGAASASILSACGAKAPSGTVAPATPVAATPTPVPSPTTTASASLPTTIATVTPISTQVTTEQTPVGPRAINLYPPVGNVPATLFGMHIHDAPTTTPWPSVPFAAWRLWDAKVTWLDLEPNNGEWHFERLDQCVALAQKHNVDVLLPLGLSPAWASARPDEPSPYYQPGSAAGPKLIEDWRKYVYTVATRYKGRIRNYEIWNEPNLPEYWSGTTREFVNLVREASVILRAIDPSISMVGPSATNRETGPPWFDDYLSNGGGTYLDVLAHHLYVYPSAPEASIAIIDRIQQIMAKHGVSDKPLWNTELGWSLPTVFSSDAEAAAYVARAYTLNWVAGVQRCYWYAWDNQEWATLWLTKSDEKTPTPAAIAYMEIQKWLVGARVTSCIISTDNTYTCQLHRDDGSLSWIVWNPDQTLTYPLQQAWGIKQVWDLAGVQRDIQGRTDVKIGIAPLLLKQ